MKTKNKKNHKKMSLRRSKNLRKTILYTQNGGTTF